MNIENLKLSDIIECKLFSEKLRSTVRRELVDSYKEFVTILYEDIDRIIRILQENPELRQEDKEDRLTIDIVNLLNQTGYDASHDPKQGGHVDLAVKFKDMLWLGEAKIHSSYDHLLEGFKQLCTRYTRGEPNQNCGGIIIYVKLKDTKSIMERWSDYLSNQGLPGYRVEPCSNRPGLAFFSEHKHDVSGLPFRVRHMPVMLHFDPQDRSGLKRKKKHD